MPLLLPVCSAFARVHDLVDEHEGLDGRVEGGQIDHTEHDLNLLVHFVGPNPGVRVSPVHPSQQRSHQLGVDVSLFDAGLEEPKVDLDELVGQVELVLVQEDLAEETDPVVLGHRVHIGP